MVVKCLKYLFVYVRKIIIKVKGILSLMLIFWLKFKLYICILLSIFILVNDKVLSVYFVLGIWVIVIYIVW